jgi:hypothetical protein
VGGPPSRVENQLACGRKFYWLFGLHDITFPQPNLLVGNQSIQQNEAKGLPAFKNRDRLSKAHVAAWCELSRTAFASTIHNLAMYIWVLVPRQQI